MPRPLSPLQVEIPRLPSASLRTGSFSRCAPFGPFGFAQGGLLGMTAAEQLPFGFVIRSQAAGLRIRQERKVSLAGAYHFTTNGS
jgi:hypothetical protein